MLTSVTTLEVEQERSLMVASAVVVTVGIAHGTADDGTRGPCDNSPGNGTSNRAPFR